MVIDPGSRTLASYYCADGGHGKLMDGDFERRILPLLKKADKMQSLAAEETCTCQRRRHLKDRFHKLLRRAKNRRIAAHRVAIQEIWKRADVVLLPRLQTARLARKEDEDTGKRRPFGPSAARQMLTWAHYEFFKAVAHSAARGEHRRVVWVEEGYTSKTCGCCGFVHPNLGGNDVFTCPSCGFRADRDLHAARNILLRALYHGPATVLPRLCQDIPPLKPPPRGE